VLWACSGLLCKCIALRGLAASQYYSIAFSNNGNEALADILTSPNLLPPSVLLFLHLGLEMVRKSRIA
jgi:hypothetical protein